MQDIDLYPSDAPTTLVKPVIVESTTPDSLAISPTLIAIGALLFVCIYLIVGQSRRRKLDPRELAFRTLSSKLGFSRGEISTIRKYAMSIGMSSPVGIIMSPELTAQALNRS